MNDRMRLGEFARQLWQQSPLLLALVALWMLLWGGVSLPSLATGIVVAVAVTRFFYLPPVELGGRFNPFWLAVFLGRFAGEVVAASFLVAAQAFGPPIRSNAVIAVRLRTRSDFIMTMTATAVSLVPGSLVFEIARDEATLYLHVLGVRDDEAVERARRQTLRTEELLLRAIGSRDDLERIGR